MKKVIISFDILIFLLLLNGCSTHDEKIADAYMEKVIQIESESIPTPEEITGLELEYQNLTEKQKKLITNYDVVKSLSKLNLESINYVQNQIDKIMYLEDTTYEVLESIKADYDALSNEEKTYIKNFEEVEFQKGKILIENKEYEKALQIFKSIREYPNVTHMINRSYREWSLLLAEGGEYESAIEKASCISDEEYKNNVLLEVIKKQYDYIFKNFSKNEAYNIFQKLKDGDMSEKIIFRFFTELGHQNLDDENARELLKNYIKRNIHENNKYGTDTGELLCNIDSADENTINVEFLRQFGDLPKGIYKATLKQQREENKYGIYIYYLYYEIDDLVRICISTDLGKDINNNQITLTNLKNSKNTVSLSDNNNSAYYSDQDSSEKGARYDASDPYYKRHDYNNDGRLTVEEFQDSMGEALYDYLKN